MAQKRVLIVDYNHLAHTYLHGGAAPLSHTVMVGGKPQIVDTTIQAYTIKAIHRWANKGQNPTAVCFDSPCKCRKAYFAKKGGVDEKGTAMGYKSARENLPPRAFDAINMTSQILKMGGVCCYKANNYEADDLVYACVQRAKQDYPDLPIDIVCNDADLLPLVDDQVSVFFRSRKYTYAKSKDIEKAHYIQVTPSNFQEVCEGISQYKNLIVPYNSLLLAKLLRGDKSDDIAGHPDWKPKMYKQLIGLLDENAEDFSGAFRYGGEAQLDVICNMLDKYIDEADLDHIRFVYRGMDLNGGFEGLPEGYNRKPAVLSTAIKEYNMGELQREASKLNIRLPI